MSAGPLLSTLRDVEGVIGSFVVDLIGQLRARDMPAMFDDSALQEAGPRIARLKEALETQGEQMELVSLAHGPHSLFLRASGELILCVLAPHEVNQPSLRMGSSLVLRRLPEALANARHATTLPPTHRPPPSAPPGLAPTLPLPPPVPSAAPPAPPAVPAAPPPAAAPPPVPVAASAAKRPRFFRGRLIEDD
ncbi:MAG: hypothetical protein KC668_14770 [Myxococcales bacterium]|nr:hypothetical protein [Myxococcales bacterium]